MWEKIFRSVLIGLVLAIDAFSVTIANCAAYKNSLNKKKEWAMPVCFALFQTAMPILGYLIGSIFSEYLSKVSGIFTAVVFFLLSAKIVFDNIMQLRAQKKKNEIKFSDYNKPDETPAKPARKFGVWLLLVQGVATSIDALFVGVTMVSYNNFVFVAAAIIGAVTFAVVSAALFIGKSLGKLLGKYAEWLGAVILFALALKELISALI